MIDLEVVHIEETDSTNRWMKENGSQKDMVVVAEYQTAGKGCGSNSWESERGKNLLFSAFIHPKDFQAKSQFIITQLVSVALCKTIERFVNRPVEIKWPNDIYVGDKKICGVLIENRLQGRMVKDTIIGVGLNVNQTTFVSDAPNPISLRQIVGHEIDREALLHDFLQAFESFSVRENTGFSYRKRLFRLGKTATFEDQAGRFEGAITEVEADGHLLIRDLTGQERRYAFKEVSFVI